MLNRIVFLYSFSIATIIVVSFTVGYMSHFADGLFAIAMWAAFAAFVWWIIPAPKWMLPFLKAMQEGKIKGTISKEQLHAAIKAGMAEIIR